MLRAEQVGGLWPLLFTMGLLMSVINIAIPSSFRLLRISLNSFSDFSLRLITLPTPSLSVSMISFDLTNTLLPVAIKPLGLARRRCATSGGHRTGWN